MTVIGQRSNFPVIISGLCSPIIIILTSSVNIGTNSGTPFPGEVLPSLFVHILVQHEYGAP